MTNYEFMEAAEAELTSVWNKLQNHSNVQHPRPKLAYSLKGGAAGEATGSHQINLNMGFVRAGYTDEMLHQVIRHEAVHCWLTAIKDPSHYISYEDRAYAYSWGRRPKRSPHGSTFLRYLAFVGGRMETKHSMDTSAVKSGWKYTCPCGNTFILSTRRHNIIRSGRKTWCRKCKGELIYVGYNR